MFYKTLKLAAALALGLGVASTANATVFTYNLSDHPNGEVSDRDYGLRLDEYGKFFSFDAPGASVQLIYDDALATVQIVGTMVESLAGNTFGDVWNIAYNMTDVMNWGGIGSGLFKDKAGNGTGSVSMGATDLALGAKANNWGTYFALVNNGHRLPGNPGVGLVGYGWVNNQDPNCCSDFLFTASIDPGSPGTIPLPAAAWMLLAGVGGLSVAARRRRSNS